MAELAYDEETLSLALQDLDGDASVILQKLKNQPQNDVVIELYSKLATDLLAKTRQALFEDAVRLYDEQLANVGLSGKASISLVDRRGDKRPENLSKDIAKLVSYNSRAKFEFPRDIVSSKSVYIEITQPGGPLTSNSTPLERPETPDGKKFDDTQMIDFLYKQVCNNFKSLNVNQAKLWEFVYNLEKIQKESTDEASPKTDSSTDNSDASPPASDHRTATEDQTSSNNHPTSAPGQSLPNGQGEGNASKKRDEDSQKKRKKKSKSKVKESSEPRSYSQIMKETESENDATESESETPSTPTSDCDSSSSDEDDSDKWDGRAGRKGTKRLEKQEKDRKKTKPTKLTGISQEESIAMYVQNIRREPGMSPGKVAALVRNHLKEKGVRCLYAEVIRNRYVDDTVGCKIIVPLRQKDKVIGIKIWPDKVKCREWEGEWDSSGASIARNFGEQATTGGLQGQDRNSQHKPRYSRRNYGYRGQWHGRY